MSKKSSPAMIGAFARIYRNPPLETIVEAIGDELKEAAQANIQAARDAYNRVVLRDGA